jgi:hypothetical protein
MYKITFSYSKSILDIIDPPSPFFIAENISIIESYYNLKAVFLEFTFKSDLEYLGVFYQTSDKKHIISGGRFGNSGLFKISKNSKFSNYLPSLFHFIKDHKYYSLVATIYESESFFDINDMLYIQNKFYLVAETADSVDANGLSFKKALKRSNLSRNLKKAKLQGLNFSLSDQLKDLVFWHKNCHEIRINELGGKLWSFNLLKSFLESDTGKLALVKDEHNKIIGGCFILVCTSSIELFMMSTPQESLNLGANFILTEGIYLYAYSSGIPKINWQSSNPPSGSLHEYKLSWNAKPNKLTLLCLFNNSKLTKTDILEKHKDLFIYPFEKIK